jgi:hypothetical protein
MLSIERNLFLLSLSSSLHITTENIALTSSALVSGIPEFSLLNKRNGSSFHRLHTDDFYIITRLRKYHQRHNLSGSALNHHQLPISMENKKKVNI